MMEGVGFFIKRGKVGQQNSCKLRIKVPCLKCFLLLILAWQQYFTRNWSCLCSPPVTLQVGIPELLYCTERFCRFCQWHTVDSLSLMAGDFKSWNSFLAQFSSLELKNPGSVNLAACSGPEDATCWLFFFENQMSTCNYSYFPHPSI